MPSKFGATTTNTIIIIHGASQKAIQVLQDNQAMDMEDMVVLTAKTKTAMELSMKKMTLTVMEKLMKKMEILTQEADMEAAMVADMAAMVAMVEVAPGMIEAELIVIEATVAIMETRDQMDLKTKTGGTTSLKITVKMEWYHSC